MAYVPRDSWIERYRVDFTEQSTQSLTPAGSYTIGGISWTSENVAAATSMDVTNGTGIVFVIPSSAAFYAAGTRTAALIRCDMADAIGAVEFARIRALRIRCRILLANVNEDAEFAKFGFEWAGNAADYNMLPGRGWPTPSPEAITVQAQMTINGSSTHGTGATSSDDAIEMIWGIGEWTQDMRSAVYLQGFPKTVTYRTTALGGMGANVMFPDGSNHPRLVLSAQPTSSATSFTATFTHLQIHELLH